MHDLRTFTPSEAAKISGVNVALQRDWRRRGFLPKTDGHARFTIFEVAEMLALATLGNQGIGPAQLQPVLRSIGVGIVGASMALPDAVAGDKSNIYIDGERMERLLTFLPGCREDPASRYHPLWQERGYTLRTTLIRQAGFDPGSIGYCAIRWADASLAFYDSPISAYEMVDFDDLRRAGAAVLIDFHGLASLLVKRAGALLTIAPFSAETGPRGLARQRDELEAVMSGPRLHPAAQLAPSEQVG